MAAETEQLVERIEACRTCGVFFLNDSSVLRQIFRPPVEDPEMNQIRLELTSWKLEVAENDGYPQCICTGCIHQFQSWFKFRNSCVDTQRELRHFYNMREENQVRIKTEPKDEEEMSPPSAQADKNCDFIYIDDLSDGEYGEYDSVAPFYICNVPIKQERIEEATVPTEPVAEMDVSAAALASIPAIPSLSHDFTTTLDATTEPTGSEADAIRNRHQGDIETNDTTAVAEGADNSDAVSCELCLHHAPSRAKLNQHLRDSHDIKRMECHICGKVYENSTAARFKFHLRWHKLNQDVKCTQCGFYCNSRLALREHTRLVHAKSKCRICDLSVLSRRMKEHMRTHQIANFECSYCADGFNTEAAREQHIWQVHAVMDDNRTSNETSAMKCDHCQVVCPGLQEYQRHLQVAHSDVAGDKHCGTGLCPHCNQFCHLADHQCSLITQHSEPTFCINQSAIEDTIPAIAGKDRGLGVDDQTYSDDMKSLDGTVELDGNERNPVALLDEPRFACANCELNFSSIEELCSHSEEHRQKHKFRCSLCPKSFELKFSLNRHMKKHNI